MANPEHLAKLREGPEAWNQWRKEHADVVPDLSDADLRAGILGEADLSRANLDEAQLIGALLFSANFGGADLRKADLREATLLDTTFGDTDLSEAKGLDTCDYRGPSILDHRTFARSGPLPLAFLRGCGLPVQCRPSKQRSALLVCARGSQELAIHSTSASTRDSAPNEKLLVILSDHSVRSDWVRDEVESCLERERREKRFVLFPVRLDDSVTETDAVWAASIRRQRHIGDFGRWKDHDSYQKAFDRLLKDLKATDPKTKDIAGRTGGYDL